MLLKQIRDNLHQYFADIGFERSSDLEESRERFEDLKKGCLHFFAADEPVHVGLKNIDWTGRHIPHQEWPARLNRFPVLNDLADVYLETGDDDTVGLARRLIEDWMDQHEYSADKPPMLGDGTLCLSIRLGQSERRGWWATVPEMAGTPVFDDEFVSRMIDSSLDQLDCLHRHMTPRGNWRISQLDCMLFCALVVPGLDRYREFAVRNLNESFHRQVNSDGSHEEHTPGYHEWMRDVYTRYWRLSNKRPELGLRIDPERVLCMYDYALCATTPDGGSLGLNDSPAWRPGNGISTKLKQRERFLAEIDGSAEAWAPADEPSRCFPDAGQTFIRDGWNSGGFMMSFDASRWGGGHSHLARNAVSVYSGSRMLLYDPGIFNYEMTDPMGVYARTTPAHNTINFGGMSQSEACPVTSRAHLFKDAAVVSSLYEGGYWSGKYTWEWREGRHPGVFGRHGRTVLWLAGLGVVVWDTIHCETGQPYAAHWQFPAGGYTLDAEEKRAWTKGDTDNVLVQVAKSTDPIKLAVYEGQRLPERGWLQRGMHGKYCPAPQLAVKAIAQSSRSRGLATLLVPFKGERPPVVEATEFTDRSGRAVGLNIGWLNGETHLVAATPDLVIQVGDTERISTDGSLVAISLRNGKPFRVIVVDGTFVEMDGTVLIDHENAGVYCERFEDSC